jgi:hypothetical protein
LAALPFLGVACFSAFGCLRPMAPPSPNEPVARQPPARAGGGIVYNRGFKREG